LHHGNLGRNERDDGIDQNLSLHHRPDLIENRVVIVIGNTQNDDVSGLRGRAIVVTTHADPDLRREFPRRSLGLVLRPRAEHD